MKLETGKNEYIIAGIIAILASLVNHAYLFLGPMTNMSYMHMFAGISMFIVAIRFFYNAKKQGKNWAMSQPKHPYIK